MSFYILEITGAYMKLGYTVVNPTKLVSRFAAHYPKFDLHIWDTPVYHPIFAKRTIKNKMLRIHDSSPVTGVNKRAYGDLFWVKTYKQDKSPIYYIDQAKEIANNLNGTRFKGQICFNCGETRTKFMN